MLSLDSTNVLFLLGFFLVSSLLYIYLSRKYNFWSSRGVNGPKPLPLFGNFLERGTKSPIDLELNWYRKYGNFYGVYNGVQPVLTVADHEVIKQILIKDFPNFINRRVQNFYHETLSLNLLNLEGQHWKRVRSIVTPSFTTGKLRGMHAMMEHCVDKLDRFLEQIASQGQGHFNAKEVFAGFTIDVIASTAFATETNANDDREGREKNPFVRNGLDLFKVSIVKFITILLLPLRVNNLLGLKSAFPSGPLNFILQLCKQIVKDRKAGKVKRSDLVQAMMEAFVYDSDLAGDNYDKLTATMDEMQRHKEKIYGTKKSLTEKEIVAQCFIFFIAGFETTSSTITYTAFELANNPEVQERLYEEILRVVDPRVENYTSAEYYDKIVHQIPYLDAVIKETLRKYPPVPRLERRVTADSVKLNGVSLPRDTLVEISTVAVHYNPDYYEEPERYNPSRWMPENKHLLVPYTYLPFGEGPRNCVGMRFAYQEIKLALARLCTKYRFERASNTPQKLQFKKGSPLLMIPDMPIRVVRRDN